MQLCSAKQRDVTKSIMSGINIAAELPCKGGKRGGTAAWKILLVLYTSYPGAFPLL